MRQARAISAVSLTGIPTTYKGIQFRSRLEAKWAAFFDLMGWRWEYEPFDLSGWIPDFILLEDTRVLVEVKPVVDFPGDIADEMEESGATDELLIVGCSLVYPLLGWLAEIVPLCDGTDSVGFDWGDAYLSIWAGAESREKNPGDRIGFCHEFQSYRDRITGCYDGGRSRHPMPESVLQATVESAWREATNMVQWRRRAGK